MSSVYLSRLKYTPSIFMHLTFLVNLVYISSTLRVNGIVRDFLLSYLVLKGAVLSSHPGVFVWLHYRIWSYSCVFLRFQLWRYTKALKRFRKKHESHLELFVILGANMFSESSLMNKLMQVQSISYAVGHCNIKLSIV